MIRVQRKSRITITLDEDVGDILAALLGGICYPHHGGKVSPLRDLFHKLDSELPARVAAYSDLFEGEVAVK